VYSYQYELAVHLANGYASYDVIAMAADEYAGGMWVRLGVLIVLIGVLKYCRLYMQLDEFASIFEYVVAVFALLMYHFIMTDSILLQFAL